MNEPCHTYKWIISHTHIWVNHVTRMNESCHTHMNKVMSQVQNFAIGHHYWSSHWFLSNTQHSLSLSLSLSLSHSLMPKSCHRYDTLHWNCYIPEIHQIMKLRFLGISWYKFKLKFLFNMNLYQGIGAPRFDGFLGCSVFRRICHVAGAARSCIHVREYTHLNESRHACDWDTSHIWMCHVYMDASYHTCDCVMSQMWMRHVTHVSATCRKYACVVSHVWMRHVAHMNASCHTHESGMSQVMSHTWRTHVRKYEWVISMSICTSQGFLYEVTTISRLPKNIGLFFKRDL